MSVAVPVLVQPHERFDVDMMHTHPFIADGSAQMQFTLVFARPRGYRVRVQFQRNGVVNTAHFDVPVDAPDTSTASGS